MSHPILSLQELSKYYVNGQNVVAGLNKVSLRFELGEFVAITGESGSGKSSLAHILGGILPYEDGELLIDGKPTSHYGSEDWERYRAESVGFISQSYGILPGATVEENVVSALRLTGIDKEQAREQARTILEEVELWPMHNRRAAKLSSGQKQRLSIARALAKPCQVLIADEPTGNLDPENSDKVIRLLAQAARTRLVILITHDYCEAENYVTRHISLQDGRIIADARLRPHAPQPEQAAQRAAGKDLSGYVSWLQLRSRPAWSAVVLSFLALTAFAVFTFLGSFLIALDDTSTRIYESDAFLNGEKTRLVAVRADGAPMTQADYDTILSLSHVEQLEKFGYIRDICYVWQEDVDYRMNYTRHNYGTNRHPAYLDIATPEFFTTGQYMQTVPLLSGSGSFLTAGSLPARFDQVVAAGDESLLGQRFTVYLQNLTEWDMGGYVAMEVTVTGVTDRGTGLYFHDDVGRSLSLDFKGAEHTYLPLYSQIPSEAVYTNYRDARSKMMYGPMCPPFHATQESAPGSVQRAMADDECLISIRQYVLLLTEDPAADYAALYATGLTTAEDTFHVAGLHSSTLEGAVAVSEARFRQIMDAASGLCTDQVSITLSDYAYASRVIEKLDEAGYYALSPYVLGATHIDPDLAAQRTQTLFICIGALAFIALLQLIVLRAMFGMQTESYRTLSDMGLTCQTAQRSVLCQVLLFTAAGQLLGLGGITLCSRLGIQRITELTQYLYGIWWAGISVCHLASTVLSAWMIGANLKKRVYPRTARLRDLIIDDEEAAQ